MISDIHRYITHLDYDPRLILARRGDTEVVSPGGDEIDEHNNAIVICVPKKQSITTNLDENLIMGPSFGTCWAGALLKANEDLVNGTMSTIKLPRKGITLSINLPGLEEYDMPVIEKPSQASVQNEIQRAVNWWLENKQNEGYCNKTQFSFKTTVGYSSEQLAASLGINLKTVSSSVATELKTTTSSDRKVAVGLFKQVYYTVRYQADTDLGDIFADGLSLADIREDINDDVPPVYVSRVDYGRILMLRLEVDNTVSDVDAKFALEYAAGTNSVKTDADTKYQRITKNARMSLVAIGGDAVATAQIINTDDVQTIKNLVTSEKHTTLSKSNPALPIAYVINFLKDDALAKINITTNYIQKDCVRYNNGFVKFEHRGAYIGKFHAWWKEGKEDKSWHSGDTTSGYTYTLPLKGHVKNLVIKAEAVTGLVWQQLGEIFYFGLEGPTNRTYKVTGTTLNRTYEVSDSTPMSA